MEFDRSRVYTAVNADEVKPGSKVFVADDIAELRQRVEDNTGKYSETLNAVNPDDCTYRFATDNSYALCYLVSEPNKPRRMTNKELARWLAQGNGQWKGRAANTIGISYSYGLDDYDVPDSIMIRGWDEAEWREPFVEEEDEWLLKTN